MPSSKRLGAVLAVGLMASALSLSGQEVAPATAAAVTKDAAAQTTAPAAGTDAAAADGSAAAAEGVTSAGCVPVLNADGTVAAVGTAPDSEAMVGATGDAVAACLVKVELDNKGRPKKKKKVKPPPTTPVLIYNGTLTVDGDTGKATLNYDIPDLKYIYIWAPGIGLTVISHKPFAGSKEQKAAFTQNTLDVMVDDHKLEIYSDRPMFDKKKDKEIARVIDKQPLPVWVLVDKDFELEASYPAMGYGIISKAPYAWPGSKPVPKRTRGVVIPPPIPAAMRPVLISQKPAAKPAKVKVVGVPQAAPAVQQPAPIVASSQTAQQKEADQPVLEQPVAQGAAQGSGQTH